MHEWGDSYWANENDFRVKFVIEGRPAVLKNSKQIVTRKNRRPVLVPSKSSKAWTKMAIAQIRAQWPFGESIPETISIHAKIITYVPDKRKRDLDNTFGGPLDAMMPERPISKVKKGKPWCGVITDDTQIKSLDGSRLRYDKQRPRVEITLRPYIESADIGSAVLGEL